LVDDGATGLVSNSKRRGEARVRWWVWRGFGHGERLSLSWLGPDLENVCPFLLSAVGLLQQKIVRIRSCLRLQKRDLKTARGCVCSMWLRMHGSLDLMGGISESHWSIRKSCC
jgi:hypothetical protein